MRVTGDLTHMVHKIDVMGRLARRHIADPKEYEEVRSDKEQQVDSIRLTREHQACAMRLEAYGRNSYKPVGDIDILSPGTYYVESIDETYRRTYVQKK